MNKKNVITGLIIQFLVFSLLFFWDFTSGTYYSVATIVFFIIVDMTAFIIWALVKAFKGE